MLTFVILAALAGPIIIGPMLRSKPKPIEYEERPFLNGTLLVPKE